MKKFTLMLFVVFLAGIQMLQGQDVLVTGRVNDPSGNPMAGVTVMIPGTTRGVNTTTDGTYSISVPGNAVLQFSFVGMKTINVPVNNRTVIHVALELDTQLIDDVIVVAYGTAKRSSYTGSASTVDSKEVRKLQISNLTKALEGAAPGLQVAMQSGQPGAGATVRIRGIGSINSSAAPLYVVDGVPYGGNINAINPADVESMTILKDAASTALYGSRAANGVIMITTKKGNVQQTRITLDARVGVNSRGISEYDIMKNPGEYFTTYWTVLKNSLKSGSGEEASKNLFGRLGYNPYDAPNNQIVDANGNLTSGKLLYHDDWGKEAFSNGIRQEYNVTLSGGSDKSTHFLSAGYLKDEGIINNSDFTRFSARSNGNYKVNENITVNGSLSFTRGEQNSQAISSLGNYTNTFMFTQYIAPIYPIFGYDKNGNRVYNEDGSPVYDFGDGKFGARAWGSNQNVVASDKANQNQIISDNISSRFGATISFLRDFSFQANIGYDLVDAHHNRFQTPSFGDAAEFNGRGTKYRTRSETTTLNQLLTYDKMFDLHHLNVLAGHESYKFAYSSLYNSKTGFFVPTIPEFNNAIIMESMESYTLDYAIESYLARLNYDYDNKYYFSASLRTDGSSRFAPENRWGTFWSVGGSWRMSAEEFMSNVRWINNLTLRASYGSVGNDDIYYPDSSVSNYYAHKTQYSISNSDGAFAISKTYQGNPDLTWESSYNMNLGISARLFDDIVNLDVEYFHKKTVDMLYNVPQPPSSGVSYISENALTMVNSGVEFTLGVSIPVGKDFKWNWAFNGTHYKNKVTNIPEDKREKGITRGFYNIREGRSVYDFYYYKYAGVNETGNATWYVENDKGELSTTTDNTKASKFYIGTALPDFVGGISTDFSWKGFELSIACNFQLGGDIDDSMYTSLMHAGSSAGQNWHRDILNAWSETNTTSNIPILNGDQNANSFSDRFLISASYFNIRNITLGYTFPQVWLSSAGIDNARVYVAADNVALFSKRKGMDPRQYIAGQSQANYSIIRTVSLGFSVNF